ncbi:hypothetical protein [Haloprofundus salinisoli]|uniref:hypothetical protein n=1 Tax=Haloprofundus salinisoli TaxID=2876193 RepID=UPI001CC8F6A1|nr:hypothetical protein [Haloprofundus salinisoli]
MDPTMGAMDPKTKRQHECAIAVPRSERDAAVELIRDDILAELTEECPECGHYATLSTYEPAFFEGRDPEKISVAFTCPSCEWPIGLNL